MFRYFPTNYVWNLSVDLAIEMGAKIGEIEEMCAPLQEAAKQPDASGTAAFRETWSKMGDKLCALAEEDEGRGRLISAGDKYGRAATYYLTAERLQAHNAAGRLDLYKRLRSFFDRGVRLAHENCERVEIPYGESHLSALYTRAEGVEGRAPILVQLNGLDSTKEMKYRVGLPRWLAQRGVSSLVVDQPGTGEALRLQGLHAVYNSEIWASKIVDWLEKRDDVDPEADRPRGRFAGRLLLPSRRRLRAALRLRRRLGGQSRLARRAKEAPRAGGQFPVPHYWDHVRWVWGAQDMDEFMRIAENVHLDGVLDRIKVPFLVTHGEKNSQIPLQWAHRTFEQLVNSPKRELRIFAEREGGVQHSSFDNSANAGAYIADWVAETLGGRTAIAKAI